MKADNLPLLELFTRLQESGLPLGLHEYISLVQSLQAGFGLPDKKALKRLCCALWVKSKIDEQIFSYHFSELFGDDSLHGSAAAQFSSNLSERQKPKLPLPKSKIIRNVIIFFTFLSLTLIVATSNIFITNNTNTNIFGVENIPEAELNEPREYRGDAQSDLRQPSSATGSSASSQSTESNEVEVFQAFSDEEEIYLAYYLEVWILLGVMIFGTSAAWLLINKFICRQRSKVTEIDTNSNDSMNRRIETKKKLKEAIDDEVELAYTIQKLEMRQGKTLNTRHSIPEKCFPLTQRQMKQTWRQLRQNTRRGPKTELDINATVFTISRQGFFLNPVMQAARCNRANLIFLLDQEGSMVPFQLLGRRLVDTATRAGRLGRTSTYYFHNCPTKYIYHDPVMQEPELVDRLLSFEFLPRSSVIVFSDAGAARNSFNSSRIHKTKLFLKSLEKRVQSTVWLNPLPVNRWSYTSAGEIAKHVVMFEADRRGLQAAVDVLRGRWNSKSLVPANKL